jgi:hypothetical protein
VSVYKPTFASICPAESSPFRVVETCPIGGPVPMYMPSCFRHSVKNGTKLLNPPRWMSPAVQHNTNCQDIASILHIITDTPCRGYVPQRYICICKFTQHSTAQHSTAQHSTAQLSYILSHAWLGPTLSTPLISGSGIAPRLSSQRFCSYNICYGSPCHLHGEAAICQVWQ